jgi:hypothetical protein
MDINVNEIDFLLNIEEEIEIEKEDEFFNSLNFDDRPDLIEFFTHGSVDLELNSEIELLVEELNHLKVDLIVS